MHVRAHIALVGALVCLTFASVPDQARSVTLPPGFDDQMVTAVLRPTALTFLPSGRLLIASQIGRIRSYNAGVQASNDVVDLSNRVCSNLERGLLGVAVDPSFQSNRFVYLYYTFKKFGNCDETGDLTPVNRVSRFVLKPNDTIDVGTEVVLVDNIPSPNGGHNGGDLHFGPDGYLYISIGDGTCDYAGDSGCQSFNDASRDPHVLLGKVLRIERDGSIPQDNPFTGPDTARCAKDGRTEPGKWCRETWAHGLRNPFRMAFDPDSPEPRLFINDVGSWHYEEIDLGVAGADYGWNVREGPCKTDSYVDCGPTPLGMTDPIYSYDRAAGCTAITGGAFVPDGEWPAEFQDDYLFADFTCGKIFRLSPLPGGGNTATEFASGLGGNAVTGMIFGPGAGDGVGTSLYYIVWGSPHGVRRISLTGNRRPVARITADSSYGSAPLTVRLSAAASEDPDGDPIEFDWDFGDGTQQAGGTDVEHAYAAGTYTATLTVRDDQGAEDRASVRIDAGNTPPVPRFLVPAPHQRFSVGEVIRLRGSATDAEDGTLAGSKLTWSVERHHDSHTHPFLPPTAASMVSIRGPAPEGLGSTTTSYLEVSLTATDSNGLSATVTRELRPRLVNIPFDAQPLGARLELDGRDFLTPTSVTSWEGWDLQVNAPEQRDELGRGLVFTSWSDGGIADHYLKTTAQPSPMIARFTLAYPRPKGATPFLLPLVPAYRACLAPNMLHGPPLDHASCGPPVQQSDQLSVGTEDANGDLAESTGSVRLRLLEGDKWAVGDQADVAVDARITDVRSMGTRADYEGELLLDLGLRITDRGSGPPERDAATGLPAGVAVTLPCVATAEAEGATCGIATSMDAVAPGSVLEGSRAIWEIGQVQVFDGGSDGVAATTPNALFATQGLFVP